MTSRFQVKNPLRIDERKKIKEAIDLNMTYREMGEYVGRAKSTVLRECRRLGSIFNYDPELAQNHFEHIQELKRKKVKHGQKN